MLTQQTIMHRSFVSGNNNGGVQLGLAFVLREETTSILKPGFFLKRYSTVGNCSS
jgi:hypothetical protein